MDKNRLTEILRTMTGMEEHVVRINPVSGGSINEAFQITTDHGNYFVKKNRSDLFPGMFESEARGLALLGKASPFTIPSVIGITLQEPDNYLILEFLYQSSEQHDWKTAGSLLALLHKNHSEQFGLDHSNYIGSLPQENNPCKQWEEFLMEMRFEPMIKRLTDQGKLKQSILPRKLRNLGKKTGEIFPDEKPSLLHGDLWSGNFMFTEKGPSLFDPAVYYGHREMDLGMSLLFSGFSPAFYEGYQEEFPLEKNWKERIPLTQLYPLLVHAVLFGDSYLWQVNNILKPY